jgi:Cu(I)/Ag(I) efflux system membrane fusion protein
VLDGVAVGEEVVVSANFLIDAESNLTSALQGLSTAADGVDEPSIPATGRNLDSAPIEDHSGHTMPTESPPASTSTHDGHGTPTESNEPPADDPHAGHRGEH